MKEQLTSKVVRLADRLPPKSEKPNALDIVSSLIAEHATSANDELDKQQHIVGDGNLQLSAAEAAHQRIEGNGNIQIAGVDSELVCHLTTLGAFLKKQDGS